MAAGPGARGGDIYDDGVTTRYLAHRHGATTSPNVVMEEPAVLACLGDLSGQRVVDLGCGDGSFAPTVLERGATSYLGIDGSEAMVRTARERVADGRARFEIGSIEDVEAQEAAAELVTSRMTLHHVRDLAAVLRSVHRSLVPGGRLLFTVAHPVITAPLDPSPERRTSWTVDDYFTPGERLRPWFGAEATWYHRTVEDHLTAVLAAGFVVEAVCECPPDADRLADAPEELARRRRVPLVLLVSARRPDRPPAGGSGQAGGMPRREP